MPPPPNATRTVDVVHVTLEALGYTADRFGAAAMGPISFATYRNVPVNLTLTWPVNGHVCQISAGTTAAALHLCDALERAGLLCERSGLRIDVHGQEHIDAEVRKMLG